MLYVDVRTHSLAKEKNDFIAPELYYEYRKGTDENIFIETYVTSFEPLETLDFSYPCHSKDVAEFRKHFLDLHNISQPQLYAFTVPPKIYNAALKKSGLGEE